MTIALTDDEVVQILAQQIDGPPRFVLMKGGLYYKPNSNGYTEWIGRAWELSEEEADKYVHSHRDESITKHRVPNPVTSDYLNSRDALAPILESLTRAEWLEVHAKLLEQYERECEANRSILPGPWLWLLRLTPRVLAFAIAEVLWKAKG